MATKQNTPKIIFAYRSRVQRRCAPGAVYYDPTTFTLWSNKLVPTARPKTNLVLIMLLARFPGWVSRGELIWACWGDDASGGPDNAPKTLDQLLMLARKLIRQQGFNLIAGWGRGYCVTRLKSKGAASAAPLPASPKKS